jgi:hypothetical protein
VSYDYKFSYHYRGSHSPVVKIVTAQSIRDAWHMSFTRAMDSFGEALESIVFIGLVVEEDQ